MSALRRRLRERGDYVQTLPIYAIVKGANSSIAQVGIKRTKGRLRLYGVCRRVSSWNQHSDSLEPERPQHDLTGLSVIAQQ